MVQHNKTIARNTLFLYFRMFITMGVSLYSSRIVLSTLGITDYGTYNLVGGIVMLFSFINSAMTSTTQRFLNFEMAQSSDEGVRRVFSVSINAHFIIMIIITLLAETAGLWFLNYKLNIPPQRLYAANIVFQFSILTFCLSILKVPYNATIIANEKMSLYAWISILEVILRLAVVFLLLVFSFDKLILYSILIFVVSVIIFFTYHIICRQMFESCRYKYYGDKALFEKLISFSGWSMFGNIALIGSNQGISIILNIFLGVAINAAMGIASQVNTAVYAFISNFQMAFNPQLVKSYAAGNMEDHKNLVFQASKFSFYLLLILAVPLLFNTHYILSVWLKVIPDHAASFTQLIILFSLIDALAGPYWVSINATGKIKQYQIMVSVILILNLPVAYLLLQNGFPPVYVLVSKIVFNLILFIYRLTFLSSILKFSILQTFTKIYLRVLLVTILSFVAAYELHKIMSFLNSASLAVSLFSILVVVIVMVFIWVLGISGNERKYIYRVLNLKISSQNA